MQLANILIYPILAVGAGAAGAAEFTGTVFFGDSLSDSGAYTAVLPPGTGKFTTNPGTVWTETLAASYGTSAIPSTIGGTNFAQGGARITGLLGVPTTHPTGTAMPISAQVMAFLATNPVADPGALYSVWAGANDIFFQAGLAGAGLITPGQAQANVVTAATEQIAQIVALRGAGARFILVPDIPDIGSTPFGVGSGAATTFTGLSTLYTTTLFSNLAVAGLEVIPLNVAGLLTEVLADPAAFGLKDVTTLACGLTSSLLCTPASFVTPDAPQTFLFASDVHPTTAGHQLIADYAHSVIEAPQTYGMLVETPVKSRELLTSILDLRLANNTRKEGQMRGFLLVDHNVQDVARDRVSPGLNTGYYSITGGGDVRLFENVIVGAALSWHRAQSDFGADRGEFETDEYTLTAFAGFQMGLAYLNAFASLSKIDYQDIRRNIQLGPLTRVATASTDGSNQSVGVTGGLHFTHGALVHGPFVGMLRQWIDVDGFAEENGGSTGLRMEDQDRDSLIATAGYRVRYELDNFTPYVQSSVVHDTEADDRDVRASLVNLPANSFGMPAFVPDNTYGTVVVGATANLSTSIAGSVQYTGSFGQGDNTSPGVSVWLDTTF